MANCRCADRGDRPPSPDASRRRVWPGPSQQAFWEAARRGPAVASSTGGPPGRLFLATASSWRPDPASRACRAARPRIVPATLRTPGRVACAAAISRSARALLAGTAGEVREALDRSAVSATRRARGLGVSRRNDLLAIYFGSTSRDLVGERAVRRRSAASPPPRRPRALLRARRRSSLCCAARRIAR
jgi:hypothetical protein